MKKVKAWPLGITIFYTCFGCALVVFAVTISSQRFDLVSKDYYDQEIAYQDRIDSITRTKALEESPRVIIGKTRDVELQFPLSLIPQVEKGSLHLYRPSDARQDMKEELALDAEGRQLVSLMGRPNGLWQARLSWQMNGESYYHEEPLVVAAP